MKPLGLPKNCVGMLHALEFALTFSEWVATLHTPPRTGADMRSIRLQSRNRVSLASRMGCLSGASCRYEQEG